MVAMVGLHVLIIYYFRSELLKLQADQSLAVNMGEFCFQTVEDKDRIYQMELYVVLKPGDSVTGRDVLKRQRAVVVEAVGQQLRQAEQQWLADPIHADLKSHLHQEIDKVLNESYLEELLITEWLEYPVSGVQNAVLSGAVNQPQRNET